MTALHDSGHLTDGAFIEFLTRTPSVVSQPCSIRALWRHQSLCARLRHDAGHRPHLRRSDAEDREWFPRHRRLGDVEGTLKHIWANYRDESFVAQFLSPG
jgi:spore cortex formation protein SpoVR/YcgB (stage V sporulation)